MNIRQLYLADWIKQYSTEEFEKNYTYETDDLGMMLEGDLIVLKCWSPFANRIVLNIYKTGEEESIYEEQLEMSSGERGIWYIQLEAVKYTNCYYDFSVVFLDNVNIGKEIEITACDPYARAVGVNGKKAMFINLKETNPKGWEQDENPNQSMAWNEMIIYELHTRDLSSDKNSGIMNRGKFLGLIESGTSIIDGEQSIKTGLDHIKELGVTHLHLLPFYDYGSVDESMPYDENKYNWGYDPVNYNAPEGSYSSNAIDGDIRIKELKKTIFQLHENGISVIMDVVYNHTYDEEFCFNKMVPGYFHRISENGVFSNGSECGNDTASERSMVRKYIVDSVLYWAKEYHVDGFRFDLLGLLDIETMQEIRRGLDEIRPNIVIYGEGWKLNTKLTKSDVLLATKDNINELDRVAIFSDDIRDAIKGSVFLGKDKGYISGNAECVEEIKASVMGNPGWAEYPEQIINYTSCHDNYTLFDKIALCNEDADEAEKIRQNKLAIAIVMLSQGIPLLHAGEEILRTKVNSNGAYVSDSVRDGDDVNSIKWNDLLKPDYMNVYQYYKGLIEFRKTTKALHISSMAEIKQAYHFMKTGNELVICFEINCENEKVLIAFNADKEDVDIDMHEIQAEMNQYQCYVNECIADSKPIAENFFNENDCTLTIKAQSCIVLKNILAND